MYCKFDHFPESRTEPLHAASGPDPPAVGLRIHIRSTYISGACAKIYTILTIRRFKIHTPMLSNVELSYDLRCDLRDVGRKNFE